MPPSVGSGPGRSLPPDPSLRFLREEAKDLLKAHRRGDPQVCEALRLHSRFLGVGDADVLAAAVSLQEVQHALALAYGFTGWAELRRHVLTAGAGGRAEPGRVMLPETVEHFKRTVDGVKEPHLGITTFCTVMRSAGWSEMDYDTLMAVSGASLLFAYHHQDALPAYAFEFIGIEERLARITGFQAEWVTYEDVEGAWQRIKETLDAGLVAYAHCAGYYIVFFGCEDAPEPEGRRAIVIGEPFDGPPGVWMDWEKFGTWAVQREAAGKVARLRQEAATESDEETAMGVLRDAVEWSLTPPEAVREKLSHCALGLAGMRAYADDIEDVAGKPADYFASYWRGCYTIVLQWDARRSMVKYLGRLAGSGLFDARVAEHLRASGVRYAEAVAAWEEFQRQLGRERDDEDVWNRSESRLAGAAAVREAADREAAAIEELRRALAAERGQ